MKLAFGYELGTEKYRDITLEDPVRAVYVIGASRAGKSSAMETWIAQDCHEDRGFAVFDVEERLTPRILRHLSDAGREPLVIDPTITDLVVPMNVLAVPEGIHPFTVIEGNLQAFKRAWPDAWGQRLEDFGRNLMTLAQELELTLGELPQLISDLAFQRRAVDACQNPGVRLYFEEHLRSVSQREYRVWVESTRNKIGALLSNPFVSAPLSTTGCIDLLELMDSGTPIIVSLPESVLGDSGRLFGMLLVSRFYQAALRRPAGARPFTIFCDEYQNFATKAFLDLTTRSRKRAVGAVVAHQSTKQPPFDGSPEFIDTMLANTAAHVVMQVGRVDAERFSKEVFPATGTQAKRRKKHWFWGDFGDPQFYSVQEEREHQCHELESQRPRECFVKVRSKDGFTVYAAEAYEVPEPDATDADATALCHASLERYGVPSSDVSAAQAARLARFKISKRKKAVDAQG